jgi:hypothetical protein
MEQYSHSPYLQAARDIAEAAKSLGDVRMGRNGQIVPASSPEAIMIATPELLMQWRIAAGGRLKQPALMASGGSMTQSLDLDPSETGGASGFTSLDESMAAFEQVYKDDGALAIDNERHVLDRDALSHQQLGAELNHAGSFGGANDAQFGTYDHEASTRFKGLGSSLAASSTGLNRVGDDEAYTDLGDDKEQDDGRALGLPSMAGWGRDTQAEQPREPGTGKAQAQNADGDFALRRRLAMRGHHSEHAAQGKQVARSGEFDENEYFGR